MLRRRRAGERGAGLDRGMSHIPFGRTIVIAAAVLVSLGAQSTATKPAGVHGVWRGEAHRAGAVIETYLEIDPPSGDKVYARLTVPAAALRRVPVGATFRD